MTFHLIYVRARSEGFAFLSASSSDTPNARGRSAEDYVSYGRAQNAPPPGPPLSTGGQVPRHLAWARDEFLYSRRDSGVRKGFSRGGMGRAICRCVKLF